MNIYGFLYIYIFIFYHLKTNVFWQNKYLLIKQRDLCDLEFSWSRVFWRRRKFSFHKTSSSKLWKKPNLIILLLISHSFLVFRPQFLFCSCKLRQLKIWVCNLQRFPFISPWKMNTIWKTVIGLSALIVAGKFKNISHLF